MKMKHEPVDKSERKLQKHENLSEGDLYLSLPILSKHT